MKQKDILAIIILLFIFILAWIGGSIYHSGVSSTISDDTSRDIAPIPPTFDKQAIDKLKLREKITPAYGLESVSPTPIISPTLLPSPIASEEGRLLL